MTDPVPSKEEKLFDLMRKAGFGEEVWWIQRLETALRGISTCSTCEACRGAARLALGEQPKADMPELNWMPFDAGVKFLSDRLMAVDSAWVLKHWDCKYLDVRVDMRTGSMLIRPGNGRALPPGDSHK